MKYTVFDAREEDLPRIEEIEIACFSCPWTLDQLGTQLDGERYIFIVAEDELGVVQGYVGMMCVLDEGYISNVAVAPECRRQGIADSLITELCNRADKRSMAFVTLEVRAGNTAAMSLYEKHGFIPVGRRKGYYDLPKEDAILMTKHLK